jgi:hypothetical protein
MSSPQNTRAYRKLLFESGICFECKAGSPTCGLRCEPCAQKNRERTRARYSKQKDARARKLRRDQGLPLKLPETLRRIRDRRRERVAVDGLCHDCNNPRENGTRCAPCAEKRNLAKRGICVECKRSKTGGGRKRRCSPCAAQARNLKPLTPDLRRLVIRKLERLEDTEPGAANRQSIWNARRYWRNRLAA